MTEDKKPLSLNIGGVDFEVNEMQVIDFTTRGEAQSRLNSYLGDDPQNPDKLVPELRMYYEKSGGSLGWPMLRHPLIYDVPFSSWKLANESFAFKTKRIAELTAEGDWAGALWFYERPYRFSFLELWWKQGKISVDELREMLPDVWRDTESPHQFGYARIVRLFKSAGFLSDEPNMIVPDEVEIYRGVQQNSKKAMRGVSWTLDQDRARWFANRFSGKGPGHGIVYRAKAKREHILAYFNNRSEQEIVVDPKGLIGIGRD